jgi:predicted flavoprotein YhiN
MSMMTSLNDEPGLPPCRRIAVIGGGASGIFAAVAAASAASLSPLSSHTSARVTVLESTSRTLQKVKVSGGGRCNVMHDTNLPLRDYVASYPRGGKQLHGIYAAADLSATKRPTTNASALQVHRFGPHQARRWFENRGVALKTERDGRMFPATDTSQTVVDCLLRECQLHGVEIRAGTKVVAVRLSGSGSETTAARPGPFLVDVVERQGSKGDDDDDSDTKSPSSPSSSSSPPLVTSTTRTLEFDAIILATGSAPAGHHIAVALGHDVVAPVPSLFTLSTRRDVDEGGLLCGLAGVSLSRARVSFEIKEGNDGDPSSSSSSPPPTAKAGKRKKPKRLEQEGPMLVTHHGLSGPAALRLSAFGAIELHRLKYRTTLIVHWAPMFGSQSDVFDALWKQTLLQPRKLVRTVCPLSRPEGETSHESEDFNDDDNTMKGAGSSPSGAASGACIPKRLWSALVSASGLSDKTWAEASKKQVRDLASRIAETELAMTGKGTFKEEFVTAGGIDLNQVHTKTMQSRIVPGLFVCGECLNVDGVTGGFNFMNAWYVGSGWVGSGRE